MFGDIVGFTAWSSVRPSQVFTLLETVYPFDEIINAVAYSKSKRLATVMSLSRTT
jgi:hypothetical protein